MTASPLRSWLGALAVGLTVSAPIPARAADRPEFERYAYRGLVRGPMSPKEAATLEILLLDVLDGYESFRVVGAGGHALDNRLLAADAARASRLRDEGVEAYLRFKHDDAVAKLTQALAVFERGLTSLTDYELLHDILLARAEAQYQAGEKGAAKASLQNLLALRPDRAPSTETHPKGFVRLYRRAKKQMGPVGRIAVECEDPGCRIQIDGKPMGPAPVHLTRVRPGTHYVVATWTYAVAPQLVRVAPGLETKVVIRRDGPAEEARVALGEVIEHKRGLDQARPLAQRIAGLARAQRVLIAAVTGDEARGRFLLLAHHDQDGDLTAVIRTPLPASVTDDATARAVREAGAALFVDHREGELELEPGGGVRPARGLAALLYLGSGSLEALPALGAPRPEPTSGVAGPSITSSAPEPAEDPGLLGAWWFWAAIGAVVVAGSVTAGVIATKKDPTTTIFEVRLP